MKKFLTNKLRALAVMVCFVTGIAAFADVNVTGTVSDSKGEVLPGATVQLKGSSNVMTASDMDGAFSLKVPSLKSTLIVTYVGYKTQEVALNGKSEVNVVLNEDSELLDELVVVGYGVQKKITLTGSVAAISGKELMKAPQQNVSNLLTGKAAGLTAVQSTGKPGEDGSRINVRGINDFAGSGPLVLVDGVNMPMDYVNPQDIESVSVLKDASAAIYGVQGANGVILITTKAGAEGKTKISYDGNFQFVQNTRFPEYLDAKEYMYYHNKARAMDGLSPIFTSEFQQQILNGNNDPDSYLGETDWIKETFQTGFSQTHNISAQGGTNRARYYASLGIMDQNGSMKNTNFKRYTFRANVDANVAKNLSFNMNISGLRRQKDDPSVDFTQTSESNPAREAAGILPVLKKEYKGYPVAWYVGGMTYNPVVALYNTGNSKVTVNEIHGNLRLEYDFKDIHPWLQGLKVSVFGNYNYSHANSAYFTDAPYVMVVNSTFSEPTLQVKGGYGGGDEATNKSFLRASSESESWKIQPQLNYNRNFGKHGVNLVLLYEAQKYIGYNFQTVARGFIANDPIDVSFAAEIAPNSTVGSHSNTAQVSYAGRFNYDFAEKYLLEFAFRYDGSYKFAPENRWGFFPSVSAGWVMSSEPFIKNNVPWISFLKLRASWGQSGKDNITPYMYNSTFNMTGTTSAVYNGNPYKLFYTANQYVYRDLKWQSTNTWNIGLDFDILNYKLGAEIDMFYQYTDDIIESLAGYYPSSLGGYYPSMRNSGSVENRGIDFTLKHQLQVGKDFSYRIRGIFGFARNRVLSRVHTDDSPSYRAIIGESLGARYGLIATGLFQTQEQLDNAPASPSTSGVLRLGDIMYKDTNGDGIISYKGTNSDYVKIGYGSLPEISFSLNMDFSYKDFYLNMLWQGVGHVDYELLGSWGIASSASTPYTFAFYGSGNAPKYLIENAWTPENTGARYPRLSTVDNGNNGVRSTFWLVNGEYVRLKSLTLGYNVPEKVLKKTPFSNINVFVSGTNLLTFSHNKYADPESPSVSAGYYPQPRTWNIGLNVSF